MASKPLLPNDTPSDGNTGTTSQKKIEANRQNAQLSTGPKSAEGKMTSSRNAAKHGLLINDVVITARDGKEDQTEFDTLLAELRDYYRPSAIVEDLLVRELAVSYWKSVRALRCERADVTCASAVWEESERSELELELLPVAQAYHSQLQSSDGIKFLLHKIEEVRGKVESAGYISQELRRWLAPHKNWDNIRGKQPLLAALEKETEELTARKDLVERDESEWRNDQRERSAIPSKEVLDRIHRYETSNVRHRYRVEARLEQLQVRRKENAKGEILKVLETPNFTKRSQPPAKTVCERAPKSAAPSEGTSEEIVTPETEAEVKNGD
jgi:hypothetical protein